MKINPEIFKAYDIRGIYKKDFDNEMAYKLGRAYCDFRTRQGKKEKMKIVVARDMRISSSALKEKLIQGIIDSGADVVDIGLASTPTFYFAVADGGYDGGILVSASHNPKEYNGFKIVKEKAFPIGKDNGMPDLRDLVMKNNFSKAASKGRVIKKEGILKSQIKYDLKYADTEKIKALKIAIDPANSMGSLYFDELFKNLNCEIVKINWELDGTFPAHEADPFKPENTRDLRGEVLSAKADLGIATDGDGDRIFFANEKGDMIEPGIIRAVLSKIFLQEKPGSKIAYDIRPGKITEDIIRENSGTPIVTPVGHSLIKKQAIEEGAYFAGESSGHFFLNTDIGCFEMPVIMILKLLQEFSESNLSVSEYIKPYQRYFHSGEINFRVKDPEAKLEMIKEKYQDGRLNFLDRISVEYPDYWFNIRTSNTEPLLRFNLEARDKKLMEAKRDEISKILSD